MLQAPKWFHDVSTNAAARFLLKRAQIAASDLAAAGVASFDDLDRLTRFADNRDRAPRHRSRPHRVLSPALSCLQRIAVEGRLNGS